ncbi:vitamin K epoxide reductase family protein [Bacteriovorax sp. BAL6_X]|uniref:vitamin K epoxide reductase/DsbA family protein n=1 Tax=Bacteriovorax sp. BAL6_X TaxID=1201290 RepID=UPI00038561D0|nr:thioredoxin domain-containing protein [Bacteriovorax sp. BAL6_X]EPZ49253.1 vitamin K epoxide reductase family protein [Bacteriovorax sp. BAL6_X]
MTDSFLNRLSFNKKILFFVAGLAMFILSIYLTNHYYQVKFPVGFGSASACNINSFLTCDAATLSPLSNIAGVPISIFGIVMGAMVMLFYMIDNKRAEGSLFLLLLLNGIGCLILFIYSLVILGTLCPFCTLYYLASWTGLGMMFQNKADRDFDAKFFVTATISMVISGSVAYGFTNSKIENSTARSAQIVAMFKNLNNLGTPAKASPYRLASSTEDFKDAPIQMSVFSDFQCPACNALNLVLPTIEKKYEGKINIQYFFYPLDHNCNAGMTGPLHQLACEAAYLASCVGPQKFKSVHDAIFENQSNLTAEWISNKGKELGVTECMAKPETKQAVVDMITQANSFNVQSTPTQLINGVKIEGVRPLSDYTAIMDHLLKENKAKN